MCCRSEARTRGLGVDRVVGLGCLCHRGDERCQGAGTYIAVLSSQGNGSAWLPGEAASRSTYALNWSGWPDSNRRPPAPKAGALTKLRHIPRDRSVAYPPHVLAVAAAPSPAGLTANGPQFGLMALLPVR